MAGLKKITWYTVTVLARALRSFAMCDVMIGDGAVIFFSYDNGADLFPRVVNRLADSMLIIRPIQDYNTSSPMAFRGGNKFDSFYDRIDGRSR